jgi:tRNA(fMet)-specific endonuclease VapC
LYLLDTDICSYFLRGQHNLLQKFQQKGFANLYVSRITVVELNVLAFRNTSGPISRNRIDELVGVLNFLDIDEPTWNAFSVLKAGLFREGKPSQNFDILQACVAIVRNLIVVTNNERHYQHLGIRTENWVA